MHLRARDWDLHLRHTFRIARGASDVRHNLIVELEALGHVGLGEAAPLARYGESRATARAALECMAPRLADVRHFSRAAARAAQPGQRAAQAAVDLALHDLAGKRLGVPVHELLGLDPRGAPPTSYTIGLDTPERAVERVREAGDYEVLKVKLGGEHDRATLEAVRDVTRQRLRVDANEGLAPEDAPATLAWLARLGVELVEQPLRADQLAETRALRRLSPLPFFADESVHVAADVPRLAEAFDGVNVKLMKCGGLAEALRLIAVARAHGMQVMLGCMIETSLGISAAAHVAGLCDHVDLDGHLLIDNDPFEGLRVERGRVLVGDRVGLGVVARA